MVLSNSKLKRKKREQAAAVAALAPPPDSNATPSSGDVVMGDGLAVLSSKTKKKKRPGAKKADGGEGDGTVAGVGGDVDNAVDDAMPDVAVEGSDLPDEGVKTPMKRRKTAPDVAVTEELPMEAGGDPGLSEVNGGGGAASETIAEQGQGEEVSKTKIRKKPRWEVDENGKRVKPKRPEGESEGPSEGGMATTSSDMGAEKGGDANASAEKNGDAAAAAPDGDRIHQGDEPWLQSKRSKKKKILDKWGKKVDDSAAVADEQAANEEAPQNGSSTEEKVDPKKIMVGGMPYYITEDDIHEFFKECGTIAELDCMTFPDTGKFKGIAFITFRTEEAAKRSLALDGADMGGRFLKIEVCKIRPREPKKDVYKEPPKKYDGCLSAYIGNLAWDISEKELRKFFKGCKIDVIRFATHKETGEFRGFGHVDFVDDESLEAAMKLDQMPVLDRPIKIAYSVPKKNKPVDAKPAQSGPKRKGCFTCGEEGHMSYNCPKKI